MTAGTYLGQPPDRIRATLRLLQHFRAFLASTCTEMRDPYDHQWREAAQRLTKGQAQRKLTWLVHIAINRKAGWADDGSTVSDKERHLRQLAYRLNTPRLIVREDELGEWRAWIMARLPERITTREQE